MTVDGEDFATGPPALDPDDDSGELDELAAAQLCGDRGPPPFEKSLVLPD